LFGILHWSSKKLGDAPSASVTNLSILDGTGGCPFYG
jgi:hypothetical protein